MADENSDGTAVPLRGDESHREEAGIGEVNTGHQTFKERWKNREYRRKLIKTLWLGASFQALGFAIGQQGPAFLDLQIITHTDVEAASFFFTATSVGYLVGSLVAGMMYNKVNKSLLMLLTVMGLAVTTVAIPWCSPYALMVAIHFVASLFAGGIDTGLAEVARVWGKDGDMAMQFLQFNYAFGAVIAPLVTEPFLTPIPEAEKADASSTSAPFLNNATAVTAVVSQTHGTVKMLNTTQNSTTHALPLTTTVHYAFLISGALILLVAIPLTVEFLGERHQKRRQEQKRETDEAKQPLPLGPFLFVSFVLCIFYFLHCGIADTFAPYLVVFVVKQLHWSKSTGAQTSSVYWASFATGRFLCIFVVRFLSSAQILVLCSLATVLSILGFLLFAGHAIDAGVWACTVASSLSMGPIFASIFIWMEAELVRVTGRMVSAVIVASAASGMVNPVVIGYLMQEFTPMWFCYLLFAESILCLLVFLFLLAIAKLYVSKHYVIHKAKVQELDLPDTQSELTAGDSVM